MEVIYHELARRDVVGIVRYYSNVSTKFAEEFRTELKSKIDQIAVNPLRFSIVGDGIRRANLHRFPYNILYETRDSLVRILVIRHHKRDPQFGIHRSD